MPEIVIKYKGVFDYNHLFTHVYEWLHDQKFEVMEDAFKHAPGGPKGTYQEVLWKAERKIDAYVEYKFEVDFRIWDLQTVEVIKEGKKKQSNFAKLRIIIKQDLKTDYAGIFKGSKFVKGLGNLIDKYILFWDIAGIQDDRHYYWMYKLHQSIKEFLDMESKTNAFEVRW
jgi:hypothetical protein